MTDTDLISQPAQRDPKGFAPRAVETLKPRGGLSRLLKGVLSATALAALTLHASPAAYAEPLLNVSYDPTRELYREFNEAFTAVGGAGQRGPDHRGQPWRIGQSRPAR